MITVRATNAKAFARRVVTALRRYRLSTDQRLSQAALLVAKKIKSKMYGERTRARRKGRRPGVYKKVGRGKKSQFKRTGDIPSHVLGIDSGHLRKSIGARTHPDGYWKKTVLRLPFGFRRVRIEAGTRVKYAAIHEYGGPAIAFGKYRFTMPKRPYFAPGVQEARPLVKRMFVRNIRLSF